MLLFEKSNQKPAFLEKKLGKNFTGLSPPFRKVTHTPQCRPLGPWQKLHLPYGTSPIENSIPDLIQPTVQFVQPTGLFVAQTPIFKEHLTYAKIPTRQQL